MPLEMSHLCPYLLTPRCRVLIEKLTGLQLVKKFPAFHGTPRFITALTSVRHLSPSWASPIQSTYPHPTSWRSILILSTHLRLGLPSGRISVLMKLFYNLPFYTQPHQSRQFSGHSLYHLFPKCVQQTPEITRGVSREFHEKI